jgi:VIT1/CCC1 family predicted Fe2+/Mn2+ transporter
VPPTPRKPNVQVSGYTTSDGRQVDGYTQERRTARERYAAMKAAAPHLKKAAPSRKGRSVVKGSRAKRNVKRGQKYRRKKHNVIAGACYSFAALEFVAVFVLRSASIGLAILAVAIAVLSALSFVAARNENTTPPRKASRPRKATATTRPSRGSVRK